MIATAPSTRPAHEDDLELVARLRNGDEAAFEAVLDTNHAALVRVAAACCDSRAEAEGLARDTWRAVMAELDSFDGRSSLRSWIFRVLWEAHGTAIPDGDDDEPAVDPDRFLPPDSRWPGHWAAAPVAWEGSARSTATLAHLERAIERLPVGQRLVIGLRDVDGWMPAEVSALLGLPAARQAALLHRARTAVRDRLAVLLAGEDA